MLQSVSQSDRSNFNSERCTAETVHTSVFAGVDGKKQSDHISSCINKLCRFQTSQNLLLRPWHIQNGFRELNGAGVVYNHNPWFKEPRFYCGNFSIDCIKSKVNQVILCMALNHGYSLKGLQRTHETPLHYLPKRAGKKSLHYQRRTMEIKEGFPVPVVVRSAVVPTWTDTIMEREGHSFNSLSATLFSKALAQSASNLDHC